MKVEKSKIAILINYNANNGNARKKWSLIKNEVINYFLNAPLLVPIELPFDTKSCLRDLLENKNVNVIISAGGDGSINYILNALLRLENINTKEIFIGGIGLGSSNDFVKPKKHFIQNIPVRLDFENACLADVGCVTFTNIQGDKEMRYFIANASLGVTAEANLLFNTGGFIIQFLKKHFPNLAIVYTALKTILTFNNFEVSIDYKNLTKEIQLSNLAILKNPHVSGDFKYDQPIQPDDGYLGLNYCEDMTKWQLVKTLVDLAKGKFSGKPKRHSEFLKKVVIGSSNFIALETDGEVCLAKDLHFSLLTKHIGLLST